MGLWPDRLGVGVAGRADRVGDFLERLAGSDRAHPVAVLDGRPAGSAAAPAVRRHADFGDLARDPAVDALVVAGTPAENAAWAMAAIRSGKHLLVDGVLAADAASAEAAVAAADEVGVCLAFAFEGRRWPAIRELERWLRPERLGAVSMVVVTVAAFTPLPVLPGLGAEAVDVFHYLFGGIEAMSVLPVGEEAAACSLLLGGGIPAALTLTRRCPADYSLRVYGTNGVLSVADPNTLFVETAAGGEILPVAGGDPLASALEDFAAAVLDDEEPEVDGPGGLRVVRALAAAERSAAAGQRVAS